MVLILQPSKIIYHYNFVYLRYSICLIEFLVLPCLSSYMELLLILNALIVIKVFRYNLFHMLFNMCNQPSGLSYLYCLYK